MLNICSIYAEYMLPPTSPLRLYALAFFEHHAHLVPHIIAQSPLNRLSILPRFPHSLVILCLPCSPACRIMKYLLACRNQRTELLDMRQIGFLFLGFLAQLWLLAHSSPLPVSGNMSCIVLTIYTSLQIIHYTCPSRLHCFANLYIFFSKSCANLQHFFRISKFSAFVL